MKTRLSPILPAVLVLAALAAALPAAAQDPAAPAARTIRVRVAPPAARSFESRLTVQGSLESKNYADVSARTDGIIDEIAVDEGDAVTEGETLLFRIDPVRLGNALTIAEKNRAVAEASLAVAEANAAAARAESDKAARDADRYRRLHGEGKVTDNEFETRELAATRASAAADVAAAQVLLSRAQLDSAAASVAIAQKNFDDSEVRAPLTGVVTERRAEPGELAGAGRVIVRIEDPSLVEAAAFLPARYHSLVVPGETRCRLAIDQRDAGEFVIAYRAPVIDTKLRTFEVKGVVDSPLAVPGAMADLAIVFDARDGLGVPSAAVIHRAGKTQVFKVVDNAAQLVEVEVGRENDGIAEILSGIAPGDSIVVEGQTLLNDGSPVEVLP